MLIDIHTHHTNSRNYFLFNSFVEESAISCSYGIHPCYINSEFKDDLIRLKDLVKKNNCLAIGECGLDKNTEIEWEIQLEVFEEHIKLSEEEQKPLIIHCVKAIQELILLKRKFKPNQPWIFHGFRKTNTAQQLLDEGFYLSIGLALLRDEKLQQTIQAVPLEKIFLETDDKEGDIASLYEKLAQLKSKQVEEIEAQIELNFEKVFQSKRK